MVANNPKAKFGQFVKVLVKFLEDEFSKQAIIVVAEEYSDPQLSIYKEC